MLVAFLFHNSAIVLFPIYFIPVRRFDRQDVLKAVIVVALMGISGVPSALFDIYGEVADNSARAAVVAAQTGGRMAYMIEAAIVLVVIYLNYDKLFVTPRRTMFTNMAILFAMLLMFFFKSDNGGRLCWYYVIGLIVTLSNVMAETEDSKVRYSVYAICLVLFVRIVFEWGCMLTPYKTFFTDGVNANDEINQKYEYDERYARNKFYR